jgi:molybdenum cofactor cytidylyltransferase
MKLSQAFRLSGIPCLALVGSGGKTTTLFILARELHPPVITAATAHMAKSQCILADRHMFITSLIDLAAVDMNHFHPQGITLVTGTEQGERTAGLSDIEIHWLHTFCQEQSIPLLVEADGSRQKPLKAPAEHEPVIPDFVDTVIVVAGLSGLGKPLTDGTVHRPEIYARLGGLVPGEPVRPEAAIRVLTHLEGGLKNIPERARRVLLLNQADTPELQSLAKGMAEMGIPAFDSVVIAALGQNQIHAVHEPVAGIILAAGESKRFGQPKQLLDWQGQSLVHLAAGTALAAGLSPVVVVTGAYAEQVETAVRDLPVIISHNPHWQQGQSSSIQTGLTNLSRPHPAFGHSPILSSKRGEKVMAEGKREVGAVIFLLADQPQVTPAILRALVEHHSVNLGPIVAPLVQGQRANPVLFDRVTFPALMSLAGDIGGRGIFSNFPVTYLPWHDESLLDDIDTPDQYERQKPK